jgi:hypothetical protein
VNAAAPSAAKSPQSNWSPEPGWTTTFTCWASGPSASAAGRYIRTVEGSEPV